MNQNIIPYHVQSALRVRGNETWRRADAVRSVVMPEHIGNAMVASYIRRVDTLEAVRKAANYRTTPGLDRVRRCNRLLARMPSLLKVSILDVTYWISGSVLRDWRRCRLEVTVLTSWKHEVRQGHELACGDRIMLHADRRMPTWFDLPKSMLQNAKGVDAFAELVARRWADLGSLVEGMRSAYRSSLLPAYLKAAYSGMSESEVAAMLLTTYCEIPKAPVRLAKGRVRLRNRVRKPKAGE